MERAIKAPNVTLTPSHRALIVASAISDDVAAERAYWSATGPEHAQFLRELDLESLADGMPGLVIPTYNYKREQVTYQLRLDHPLKTQKGGTLRYKEAALEKRVSFAFDIAAEGGPGAAEAKRLIAKVESERMGARSAARCAHSAVIAAARRTCSGVYRT